MIVLYFFCNVIIFIVIIICRYILIYLWLDSYMEYGIDFFGREFVGVKDVIEL